jgi:hypothetical protein
VLSFYTVAAPMTLIVSPTGIAAGYNQSLQVLLSKG